ncbi:MAG: hypothetical protein RMK29_09865 [Myxococcales bacterium]|nr:hypothetical protein [Myxococcota bacterium]MDW8282008.1 hypothetical protein [Myxococcales bacterium]
MRPMRPTARGDMVVLSALLAVLLCPARPVAAAEPARETECNDGIDNDGDTVYDCGDADCADSPHCRPDGRPESTNSLCSDWIDNDGDGQMDCDDPDCQVPGISVCQGSYQRTQATLATGGAQGTGQPMASEPVPELGPGMSVEDLIGRGNDKDGERSDELCADGIDNDGDGRTDCQDFGCRFDPSISVCQGQPNFSFSVVARTEVAYQAQDNTFDARFSRLQLRVLGPIPFIRNSFFLLNVRAERTPRLTFAMFQVPLGKRGHYANVSSGTGGLSSILAISIYKQLLLDPPFYLVNAFQQPYSVAVEFGGPIDRGGRLLYRALASAGTGRFTGNVGGTFLTEDNSNFAYQVAAQIHWNVVGFFSRWDSPLLYTPVPLAVALALGVKWEQRPLERFPAANLFAVLRYRRLLIQAETYGKREIEFGSWGLAYNIQVGVLAVSKWLMLGMDVGQFVASGFDHPPAMLSSEMQRQLDELQWRAAVHLYFYRSIGTVTAFFMERRLGTDLHAPTTLEREARLAVQFRF